MRVVVKAQLPQSAAEHMNSTHYRFQFKLIYQVVNCNVKRAETPPALPLLLWGKESPEEGQGGQRDSDFFGQEK